MYKPNTCLFLKNFIRQIFKKLSRFFINFHPHRNNKFELQKAHQLIAKIRRPHPIIVFRFSKKLNLKNLKYPNFFKNFRFLLCVELIFI